MNKKIKKLNSATVLGSTMNEKRMEEIYRHFQEDITKNIEMVEIEKVIIPQEYPRSHDKKQIAKLVAAFRAAGYCVPIIITRDLELIAGRARLEALIVMKEKIVPAVILDDVTPEERIALRIMDNRLSQDGTWVKTVLQKQVKSLEKTIFTKQVLGFENVEHEKLFMNLPEKTSKEVDQEEDISWIDKNIPPRAKLGDLWRCGNHFVFCGDALKRISYEIVMKDEKARVCVTDQPYNRDKNDIGNNGKTKHENFVMGSGEMSEDQFREFIKTYMSLMIEFSVDGSLHYLYTDWQGLYRLLDVGYKQYTELKNIAVWVKTPGMGQLYRSSHEMVAIFKNGKAKHTNNIQLGKFGRFRSNVWDEPSVHATNPETLELLKFHPTVKNCAQIHSILEDCSEENEIVLDCFGGSGTTLLAAERSKRRARLIELNPRFVDVILYRFEQETGKTAKLEGNYGGQDHE